MVGWNGQATAGSVWKVAHRPKHETTMSQTAVPAADEADVRRARIHLRRNHSLAEVPLGARIAEHYQNHDLRYRLMLQGRRHTSCVDVTSEVDNADAVRQIVLQEERCTWWKTWPVSTVRCCNALCGTDQHIALHQRAVNAAGELLTQ